MYHYPESALSHNVKRRAREQDNDNDAEAQSMVPTAVDEVPREIFIVEENGPTHTTVGIDALDGQLFECL